MLLLKKDGFISIFSHGFFGKPSALHIWVSCKRTPYFLTKGYSVWIIKIVAPPVCPDYWIILFFKWDINHAYTGIHFAYFPDTLLLVTWNTCEHRYHILPDFLKLTNIIHVYSFELKGQQCKFYSQRTCSKTKAFIITIHKVSTLVEEPFLEYDIIDVLINSSE